MLLAQSNVTDYMKSMYSVICTGMHLKSNLPITVNCLAGQTGFCPF